jgi:hypothetical protein
VADFHRLVAEPTLWLAMLTLGWALLLLVRHREPDRIFYGLVVVTAVAVATVAVLGLLTLAGGGTARDSLHLVYGALAVAALPVAAIYAVGHPLLRRLVTWLAGGAALLVLLLRLSQTG